MQCQALMRFSMAKASEDIWEKAKALYEKGDSLRDIEKEVGIPYKTIDNRAKVHGWGKGILAHHIADSVRVQQEFGTMDLAQQTVVSQEVNKQVQRMEWLNTAALKNASDAMKAPCDGQVDFKHRADTISKAKEVLVGKNPEIAVQVNTQLNAISLIEHEALSRRLMNEI